LGAWRGYSFKGKLTVLSVSGTEAGRAYFDRTIAPLAGKGKEINLDISIRGNEVVIKNTRPFRLNLTHKSMADYHYFRNL
jgi:hypothetical protein